MSSQPTSQDFQELTRALSDLTKRYNAKSSSSGSSKDSDIDDNDKKVKTSLGVLATGFSDFTKHLVKSTTGVSVSLSKLTSGLDKTHSRMTNITSIFVATAGLVGSAIESNIRDTFKQYQGLREVGETFGGSLIGLSLAAAHSRMSLDEYAKFVKDNSQAAKVVPIGEWSRGLRESLKSVGELGMTTDQLNGVVSNYTKTLSLFGQLSNQNTHEAAQSMANLAVEANFLATVSGKERAAIMADANKAMDSATLRAQISMMEGQSAQKVIESTTKATMYLASLPGEAGSTLSKMLADTIGTGAAFMTDGAQEFTKAGLYGVQGLMDQMADKVKNGQDLSPEDQANFYQEFLAEGKANMATLRLQAQAGNEAAKKAIAMITDMENNSQNYTATALRKAKETADAQSAFTKNISNLQENFKELGGGIRETFWKVLDNVSNDKSFQVFTEHMKTLGAGFKSLFDRVFTKEHIEAAMHFAEVLGEKLLSGANKTFDALTKMYHVLGPVVNYFASLSGILKLVGAYFLARIAMKRVAQVRQESAMRIAIATGTEQALGKFSAGRGTLRVTDGSKGGSGWGPEETKGGSSGKGRLGRSLGRLGRFGGAAVALGGMALDAAPDFKGKQTLSSAMEFGGMGAQIGAMFGPLGMLIGGGIGALAGVITANWEPIKAGLSKAISWIGDVFGGIWDWVKLLFKFSPLGMAVQLFESIKNNGLTKTWDNIKASFSSFFDSFGNIFTGIGTYLQDKFSWLSNFDVFGIMRKAISALPGGKFLVEAFDKAVGSSPSGPSPASSSAGAPNADVDRLQNLVNQLQKQNADMQRNMQQQQQVMMKILEALQHGNAQERAIAKQATDQMKQMGYKLDSNRA